MDQTLDTDAGSSSASSSGSSSAFEITSNELSFLDYLSTDFLYLHRFILASQQMERLLPSDRARGNAEMQEKLVNNIEIAKETLAEAGASARPFISCPPDLALHRQAYFDMLTVARGLVPHVEDADTKLRLRRLLLPLTSMSRFRVALAKETVAEKDRGAPLPTWWDKPVVSAEPQTPSTTAVAQAHGPSTRKKFRRCMGTANLKFLCSSAIPQASPRRPRSLAISSVPSSKSHRMNPYARPSPRASAAQSSASSPSPGAFEHTAASTSSQSSTPPQQHKPLPQHGNTYQPLSEIDNPLFVLSNPPQQQRNLGPGYAAFQKSVCSTTPSNWDWYARDRLSLGGLDCNLPAPHGVSKSTTTTTTTTTTGSAASNDDEAESTWYAPVPLGNMWNETGAVPTPAAGLTWCTSWDDAGPRKVQGAGSPMVLSVLSESTGEKSLADSTCVVM